MDALVPGGDEGRGTLREATGSREQALIRGCPNGATPPAGEIGRRIHRRSGRTRGTETSQYPEEETSTEIPRVVASESGRGQWPVERKPNTLGRVTAAGESPVGVGLDGSVSKAGHVKPCPNVGGPPSKPKYSLVTDSAQVP